MKNIAMTMAYLSCLAFITGCKSVDQKLGFAQNMSETYGYQDGSEFEYVPLSKRMDEANQKFAETYGYQDRSEFEYGPLSTDTPRYSSSSYRSSSYMIDLDLDLYSDFDLAAAEAGYPRSVRECVVYFDIKPTGNKDETIRLISEQGKIIRGKFQAKINKAKEQAKKAKEQAKRESEKRRNDARRRFESTYGSESERNRGDWKALGVHREFERNPAQAAERLRGVEIRIDGMVRGFGTTYDSNLNEVLVVKLGGNHYEDEFGFKTISIIGTPSNSVPNKNSFWSVRVKLIGQTLNTPVFQYLGW